MSELPPSTDGHDDSAESRVVIVVVRSGGVGGIRRRWRVEPPHTEVDRWVTLVESCPWDAPPTPQRGADRFVWSIRVRTPSERHEQELPDAALDGPWRELVDAVREASGRQASGS
ncbi:protealysin inhibitor emfourin [Microbacterium sp. ZW T5_45]|uniref:protealysin inhibitor emfourin n=1 Tax=Microbacterium sp. ZW T5_45 TaxID=3378080 RepID=UPI0038553B6F